MIWTLFNRLNITFSQIGVLKTTTEAMGAARFYAYDDSIWLI